MKSKIGKTFCLAAIVLLLGIVFAPNINAVAVPKPKTLDGEANMEFFICRVSISGITDIYWIPTLGWVVESNGTASIKSWFSLNYDTNEHTYFGEYQYSGRSMTVLHRYLLRHSSEANQMEGISLGVYFWIE